jgi:glycosyltransferase involved in cell wall biosynthesis
VNRLGSGSEPVRVAFFPMHPPDDRATDTFCVLPTERGRAFGIEGALYLPSSSRLYEVFYRRKSRGWKLRAFAYWYLVVLPRRFRQLVSARHSDVVFVQRSMFRWKSPPVLEWVAVRLLRKPVVYHLDDGIWLAARRRWSVQRCSLVTVVVTGNDTIAAFGREAGAAVQEIEYALDATAYPVHEHAGGKSPVIGYIGIYPQEHLAPIADALAEACRAAGARVRVVGGLRKPDLGHELEPFLEWRQWDPRDQAANLDGFDIGIMPLADTEIHRAKEPLKIKEYMAAGLPIVASPVGHNLRLIQDGEQGYFASTPEEWTARLTQLADDPPLRRTMGARGRSLIERSYDLPRLLGELAAVFREVGTDRPAAAS